MIKKIPLHVNPFPENPSSHEHWNDPIVLMQAASGSQPPLSLRHSLISVKKTYFKIVCTCNN